MVWVRAMPASARLSATPGTTIARVAKGSSIQRSPSWGNAPAEVQAKRNKAAPPLRIQAVRSRQGGRRPTRAEGSPMARETIATTRTR